MKPLIIYIAIALCSSAPPAHAPVQDDYRVEVLEAQVQRLKVWEHLGRRKGWHMDAENHVWR